MIIAVIIPTLNEAPNIAELVRRVDRALKADYKIVIVDDNSTDGTQDKIIALQKMYPIELIRRPGKMGLASAVIDGMKAVHPDAYIVMDADLSHPPELLPEIRDALIKYELVVASRYVPGGGVSGWPIHRQVILRVSCLLAKGLTAIQDRTSGYFGVRAALLAGVELSPIGYKIGLECIVKATQFPHYSWTEIPYTFVDRKLGRSKLGPGEFIDYLRHLKALYKHMLITVLVQAKIGTIKT